MGTENRNPEYYLEQIKQENTKEHKGKLQIFFGYAAGVGKTYNMLVAAKKLLTQGRDVVIGYIEPHPRKETQAQQSGFEVVPTKKIKYGSLQLEEVDVEGIIARQPEYVLIDELAHSNAEGSIHAKRYQDVEDLLQAGINVYTTLNVQHIESLNDLVETITNVVVRERVPDYIFDNADEVFLVDITPQNLIDRLKEGKIYHGAQIVTAVKNFFTKDNLAALRDIAVRRVADRIGLREEVNKSTEHILVCLSPSDTNPTVIRQGARMAKAFHGRFSAIFVDRPEVQALSSEMQYKLEQNIALAEQLGAHIVSATGNDVAQQIVEYTQLAKVSKLVLGRQEKKKHLFSKEETFSDRIMQCSPTCEVFLIPVKSKNKYSTTEISPQKEHISFMDFFFDMVKVLGLITLATLGGSFFWTFGCDDTYVALLFVLVTLLTTILTIWPWSSLVSAVFSMAIFNYIFTTPYYSFGFKNAGDIVTSVALVATALIGVAINQKLRAYAKQAAERAYRTEILLETVMKLLGAENAHGTAMQAAKQLHILTEKSIILFLDEPLHSLTGIKVTKDGDVIEKEVTDYLEVAQWVYQNNKNAGYGTVTLTGTPFFFMPIAIGDKVLGVVGVDMSDGPLTIFGKNLFLAVVQESAMALERFEKNNREKQL